MESEVIKFRIARGDKTALFDAAEAAGMTVSDLMRRAGKAAIKGRIASRPILVDLAHVRSTANRLDALAAVTGGDVAKISAEIKAAAEALRVIVRRHLESGQ
ncbi:hypothetical protein XH98_28430 [Bradyrhizobium sp. CCBAU 51745]|uniref:hypothetical protein n=1 Tax=Bradyrhizobium sp. CCBAU 51745 TaxID=1325099 RepID=UPI002305AD3F|nr:hypothetical protein [Bradyrhizobium sp. CCBAU 51745]MDA9442953.1 hypothetical protein [Bradyrhizobium sp. CCBAU 51745]